MSIGNVSVQTLGGATTLGVIGVSGDGISFLDALYRYANLTLPYNPNDPGLTYTYDNSTLVPVVLLYARFFNLLNEPSVPLVANVGTSAFGTSGSVSGSNNCLDVRAFGAKGDGVTDDTAAIQAALNQAASNYLGNKNTTGTVQAVTPQIVQSATGGVANGTSGTVTITLPLPTTMGNFLLVGFTAFNYNAAPVVSDEVSSVYTQVATVSDGEERNYLYIAPVSTPGLTQITITIGGRQFNSYIAPVAFELSGISSGTPETTNTAVYASSPTFVGATINPVNKASIVISLALNAFAAGVVPTVPNGFTSIAAATTPQPNGLNGSVPVTALAYGVWNGVAALTPKWGGSYTKWGGATITAAFQLSTVTIPTTIGFTTVCIPQGVLCLVNPVALDERLLPKNSCRYGAAAYSLVIDDGVTLEIDGALIANPAANAAMVSADHTGDFGWFLVINKKWLANNSITTAYNYTPGGLQFLDGVTGGTIFNDTIPFPLTLQASGNDFLFYASVALAATVQAPYPNPPAGFSFLPALQNSPGPNQFTYQVVQAGQTTTFDANNYSFNHSNDPLLISESALFAAFKILPGETISAALMGSASGVNATVNSFVAIPANAQIWAILTYTGTFENPGTYFSVGSGGCTDSIGNVYTQIAKIDGIGLTSGDYYGTGVDLYVCFNPKAVPAQTITYTIPPYEPYADQDVLNNVMTGVSKYILLVTGAGGCGYPLIWSQYLASQSFNEGARNTGISITGTGTVVLNGDNQLAAAGSPSGQLYPVGLARFVATDNSDISELTIQNPFGCAIQWLNSNSGTISSLTIENASNGQPNLALAVQDPGIIEIDMMRTSVVTGCSINQCALNRGILDWAGNQNTISSNTFNECYTGYEYRDADGEWGYFFGSSSPVTQDSEITQNKAVNCTTDPASAGFAGSEAGSNGFLFYGGWYGQPTRTSVTGVSFHDNIGNNNSTDFSYTTYVSFRTLQNNTFGTSSGSGSSGGGGINNGQISVPNEIPAGAINGTNTTFTLDHPPISGSLNLYLNGLYEQLSVDYTIVGNVITLNVPPNTGSLLTAAYIYLSGT